MLTLHRIHWKSNQLTQNLHRFGSNIAMRGKGNTILEKLLSLPEAERQGYLNNELLRQELTLDYYQRLKKLADSKPTDTSLPKQITELKQVAQFIQVPDEVAKIEIDGHTPT
jgi:hypothetical protein